MQRDEIDFIGVGAPKCGTTWVAQMLDEHPDICVPKKKELNYFNEYWSFYLRNQGNRQSQYKKNNGDIATYLQYFSECSTSKKRGEFSVMYLFDKKAPELIAQHFPDVKIIIMLRNPIEKLYSNYLFAKKQGYVDMPDLKTVIERESEFVNEGCYIGHIYRYLKFFPREQIFLGLHDDVRAAPVSFLHDLYAFLDVDVSFVPKDVHKKINATARIDNRVANTINLLKKHVLSTRPGRQLYKISLLRYIFRNLKTCSYKLTKLKVKKLTDIEGMDQLVRKKLQRLYRMKNKELEKLLGRDLNKWQ